MTHSHFHWHLIAFAFTYCVLRNRNGFTWTLWIAWQGNSGLAPSAWCWNVKREVFSRVAKPPNQRKMKAGKKNNHNAELSPPQFCKEDIHVESQGECYACEKCSPHRHKKSSGESRQPNTCWWRRRTAAKVGQAAHSRRSQQPDDQAKISPNATKAVIHSLEALRQILKRFYQLHLGSAPSITDGRRTRFDCLRAKTDARPAPPSAGRLTPMNVGVDFMLCHR